MRWRHLIAAIAAAGALAPSAAADRIRIEAGTVQRVEVEFPPDLPREVALMATVEVPEYLRDQVAIDVLPRELVLRPGESPGVHLKIESDACSPSVYFRAKLILRSERATTVTPLYFRVENSPVECWGPVALRSALVALLIYVGYSWIINLRLFSLHSTERIEALPHNKVKHRELLWAAIRRALQPRARLHAWLRSGAWWRSLFGMSYRETIEIDPRLAAPGAAVVPQHRRQSGRIYLEADFGDTWIDLAHKPKGFQVKYGTRRVALMATDSREEGGWVFRGRTL